jgi:hypothetical protein
MGDPESRKDDGMDKKAHPVGVIQMVSSDLIKQDNKKEDLS